MGLAFSLKNGRAISRTLALAVILALAAPLIHAQDAAASETTKRKVKSRVAAGYPALARQMGVTGKVKVEVTITADGKVSNAKVVGGSPVLVTSAVEAVRKWKFEPGPKETTEIVEFAFKDPSN